MTPAAAPLLDAAGIRALVPHAGRMSLLDTLQAWDAATIRCTATGHTAPDHPLRSAGGLLAPAAIEYAAQAAALHGGLTASASGTGVRGGLLASARAVQFHRLRLDDLPGPLTITAERQAGDARQWLYAFTVTHGGLPVAEGRLTVVLEPEPESCP
ncbi:hydroxymyristoyl-ACP dehydratase [Sphaerotilus sp.]|uniref:hydroxymyristoyl-ACP dehydratase n=1 Tax=Sphaerotilus sp. TaxID=2093942 RepID=UPI0034E2425B